MDSSSLRARLLHLHELILKERQCCKEADMTGLEELLAEKAQLIGELEPLAPLADPGLRALADLVKNENRRNAYLIWVSLRFIRESMTFFSRETGQQSYGASGRMIQNGGNGLVLSGRV